MPGDTREERLARRIADLYAADQQYARADLIRNQRGDRSARYAAVAHCANRDGGLRRPARPRPARSRVRHRCRRPHGRGAAAPLRHPDLPRDVDSRKALSPTPSPATRSGPAIGSRRSASPAPTTPSWTWRCPWPAPSRCRSRPVRPCHNCTRSCSRPSRSRSSPASTTSPMLSNSARPRTRPSGWWCSTTTREIDDHREAFESASARLADRQVSVEEHSTTSSAGHASTPTGRLPRGDSDALRLLIYTSGSTALPRARCTPTA